MSGLRNRKWSAYLTGVMALVLAVVLGLTVKEFSLVSYAATGTISAGGTVNIRKEPSTTSEILAGVTSGNTVTVNSKTKGADGNTWYQVVVDSQRVGYIRSDLITVSGDVPDEGAGDTTPSSTPEVSNPSATYSPTVEIVPVQPVSATLGGGDGAPVRVRGDADNNSTDNIITQLDTGTVITVTGYATGTDGNTWYQISFDMNGTSMQGFVRYDYALLDGGLSPVEGSGEESSAPQETEPQETGDSSSQPPASKDYEIVWGTKTNGEEGWLLNDYVGNHWYEMDDVINFITVGKEEYKAMKGTVTTQRIIIGVLAVLAILGVGAATVLFFKIREINDDAYFTAVEKQTMRERNEGRRDRAREKEPQPASGRRQIPTVGADGQKTNSQNRSQRQVTPRLPDNAQRSVGTQTTASRTSQGQAGQVRPAASRTAGGQSRQAVPQGTSGRTSGQAGAVSGSQGRPDSGQMRGASQNSASRNGADPVRPASGRAQDTRTARPVQSGARPSQNSARSSQAPKKIDDDDGFDFEFLNWDGEDK